MERENTYGMINLSMMDNGQKIRLMDQEFINGQMEDNILDNGRIIICMEEGFTHGKMGEDMKVSTITIGSMEMVNILGLMEESILVNGLMENNMAREYIGKQMGRKKEVFGRMESVLNGWNDIFRKHFLFNCIHKAFYYYHYYINITYL